MRGSRLIAGFPRIWTVKDGIITVFSIIFTMLRTLMQKKYGIHCIYNKILKNTVNPDRTNLIATTAI